ncbi:MAG: hypothetical protein JW793_06435 [Acidobacteria bacterium]|nr:hypothetical protein [Acidobacteriota bacterium]
MKRFTKPSWRIGACCLLWAALAQTAIGILPMVPSTGAATAYAAVILPSHAPDDFIEIRPDIPKGRLETITYNSKSIGVDRKAVVYTPPNYEPDRPKTH